MTIRFGLQDESECLATIASALHKSRRCVVVTGAGISVSGGIPDFRSADGLYNLVKARYPNAVVKGKDLFDAALFRDPTSTSLFYTFMAELKNVITHAEITPTHRFVKQLDVDHKLLRCYTQNIDSLELRLEMSSDLSNKQAARIVQLHGDLDNVICTMCNSQYPFDAPKSEVFREGTPPPCPECQTMQTVRSISGKRLVSMGTLRPNIVLYNEHHKKGEQIAGLTEYDVKKHPDLLIIMGTSLNVVGIKRLVKDFARSVHQRNGIVVFVNNTEVGREWDSVIDYHIQGATDDVVARLTAETAELEAIALTKAKRLAERKEIRERKAKLGASETDDIVVAPVFRKRPAKTVEDRDSLLKKQRLLDQPEDGHTLVTLTPPMHEDPVPQMIDVTIKASEKPSRKIAKPTRQPKLVNNPAKPKPASTMKLRKATRKVAASAQPTLTSLGMRATKARTTSNSKCTARDIYPSAISTEKSTG